MNVAICIYLLLVVLLGIVGILKTKTFEDHVVANRELPWGIAALSIAATLIGTGATLGVGEMAYKIGISSMLYPTILGVSLLVSMFVAAARFRASNCYTIPELLSADYGETSRYVLAVATILRWVGPTAAQFLAAGVVLTSITGWDLTITIIVSACVILFYTILGGMWSASITDALQVIVIYIALVLLSTLTIKEFGGMSQLLSKLPSEFSSWTNVGIVPLTSWLGGLISLGFVSQPWLQRCASVTTPKNAVKAGILAGLLVLPVGLLSAYVGVLARVQLPGLDAKAAVPAVIMNTFSPFVAGIFVASIIAAAMSCADSWIHSSATLMVKDIYLRIKPNASSKEVYRMTVYSTIFVGILALVLALMWKGGIIMLVMFTGVWSSVIYIGPLLVSWFLPIKLKPRVGLGIMLFLLVLGPVLLFSPNYIFKVHPNFSLAIIALAVTVISLLIPGATYSDHKETVYDQSEVEA
ncbi:sodium:solute symporter family protein [Metallumcola ferriviriculae]|uniref:Sodium:solute symporter family protein n=1 Tax=Metallumcola ferriviriculae TaxID=3039180 RepID=A0AAU0UKU5_9FIRM|nr:sodium:solute symporter family protein [Desulfitibacteraceae bacterium MK1]